MGSRLFLLKIHYAFHKYSDTLVENILQSQFVICRIVVLGPESGDPIVYLQDWVLNFPKFSYWRIFLHLFNNYSPTACDVTVFMAGTKFTVESGPCFAYTGFSFYWWHGLGSLSVTCRDYGCQVCEILDTGTRRMLFSLYNPPLPPPPWGRLHHLHCIDEKMNTQRGQASAQSHQPERDGFWADICLVAEPLFFLFAGRQELGWPWCL